MMAQCPNSGSSKIIPDLILFAGDSDYGNPYVSLNPPKGLKGDTEPVSFGFRIDVCGSCGHAEIHTKYASEILDAHKKGTPVILFRSNHISALTSQAGYELICVNSWQKRKRPKLSHLYRNQSNSVL